MSCPGADFTKCLSLVSGSKLETFVSNYWNIILEPTGTGHKRSLRLVGSGLKFCKQRLKYGYHNSFSVPNLKWLKIRYKCIKELPRVIFGVSTCLQGFLIAK